MATLAVGLRRDSPAACLSGVLFRPIYFLITSPSLLFFATLIAMLFRPPDLHFYNLDRIALGILVGIVMLRAFVLRHSLHLTRTVSLPLVLLIAMGLLELLSRPAQTQDWRDRKSTRLNSSHRT